jgi:hypothetical protein
MIDTADASAQKRKSAIAARFRFDGTVKIIFFSNSCLKFSLKTKIISCLKSREIQENKDSSWTDEIGEILNNLYAFLADLVFFVLVDHHKKASKQKAITHRKNNVVSVMQQ